MSFMWLRAEFSDASGGVDKRSAVRRQLRFESSVVAAERHPSKVVVLDLSEAGMMLNATDELAVGETFQVDLPEAGLVDARIVWKRMTLYGCEFLSAVSRGVISATLLRATHDRVPDRPA